jgi:glycosyltransferase involved in cell wall biosynthesis
VFDACIQINLQRGFGGGEVYTAAFARALGTLGIDSTLFIHPRGRAWSRLQLPGTRVEAVKNHAALLRRLERQPGSWLVFHTFARSEVVEALQAQGHFTTAFAHMPLYGRDPQPLRPFDVVLGVSRHVIASLHDAGIEQVYPQPMYGTADLDRLTRDPQSKTRAVSANSRYEWDRRKLRDRLLGFLEPLWRPLLPARRYERRPGLTLGIVSRLTPIKQFPLLFSHLAGVLARYPSVRLEIFGSGGYASVRDLAAALRPVRARVRYWGHQSDVSAVYASIDWLLSGLGEKEALGLNIIEAQACGTPVLAADTPPFTETVLNGRTGLLYADPRQDAGADFERKLRLILDDGFRFDPVAAEEHLAQFSEAAFTERVRILVDDLAARQAAIAREIASHEP